MNIVVALLIMLASLAAIYASNRYEYARAALLVLFAVAMELMGLYLLYKSKSTALATLMTGERITKQRRCAYCACSSCSPFLIDMDACIDVDAGMAHAQAPS